MFVVVLGSEGYHHPTVTFQSFERKTSTRRPEFVLPVELKSDFTSETMRTLRNVPKRSTVEQVPVHSRSFCLPRFLQK